MLIDLWRWMNSEEPSNLDLATIFAMIGLFICCLVFAGALMAGWM